MNCSAISSANAIFEIVPRPSKVFWTGQSWDDEIKAFNPTIGNSRITIHPTLLLKVVTNIMVSH